MNSLNRNYAGKIKLWLHQMEDGGHIVCTIVFDDETVEEIELDALSIQGAAIEATGLFIAKGWTPTGAWVELDATSGESVRQFVRTANLSEGSIPPGLSKQGGR